jgi:uncharacterized membrane protein YheB (UPF0754 family)
VEYMNNQLLENLLPYLPWVLPPLLGAVIGYVTNALAIRMLFRPLRRMRFLGVPVPFTPGVIPRRREELARSIGNMVSRELLTLDVFARRFQSESFRRALRSGLYRLLDDIGNTPVHRLDTIFDPMKLHGDLAGFVETTLRSHPELLESLLEKIAGGVSTYADVLTDALDSLFLSVRPLRSTTDELVQAVVLEVWPHVRETAERGLHDAETQRQLQGIVRRVLAYTLDQLNGFQRLVVSAGQYDRQLLAKVPSIAARMTAEIAAFIHRPDITDMVVQRVTEWLEHNRYSTVEELVSPSGRHAVRQSVRAFLVDSPRVEAVLRNIADTAGKRDGLRRVFQLTGERLREFLQENSQRTLSELFPWGGRRKAYWSRRLAARLVPVLGELAPRFVAQLDIYRVVVDRINDLDIRRVEDLLLGIIREHLRWINIFGAILGAVIGAVQLLLRVTGL